MKILQINSVLGFGSTGRIVTDLYKLYEEAGHNCVIAFGRGEALEGYKTIKIGSNLDNYIHVAKTRIFDKHGLASVKATKEFIKKVEKYNPDIVHLHNIHGYYINIEILFDYLKKANKKVIWTLHDCWAFTGHCTHFDYVGCDKWRTECSNCCKKNIYPSSNIFDNSKFNYRKKKEIFTGVKDLTIVTPSKWLAQLVKESFLGEYKVKVINNGIDNDIFKPTFSDFREKYGIGDKKIILGVANIWLKEKGYEDFKELSKKLDSNIYQIVLVGKMNKDQINSMPKEIIWIQQTSDAKELAKIYTAADIFLNPSYEETQGLVSIEALSCGAYVIVRNRTALPEVIEEKDFGEYGIYSDNFSEELITDTIKGLENYDKRKSILRGREFNKKIKFNEYVNFVN